MMPKSPKIAKKSSKRQAFRALRNIMKQKNATTQHTNIFTIMKNPARRTAQKVTPKDPKRSKHDFKCAFVGDLAWRTARSAFNKLLIILIVVICVGRGSFIKQIIIIIIIIIIRRRRRRRRRRKIINN
jgi:hypothetical protein